MVAQRLHELWFSSIAPRGQIIQKEKEKKLRNVTSHIFVQTTLR